MQSFQEQFVYLGDGLAAQVFADEVAQVFANRTVGLTRNLALHLCPQLPGQRDVDGGDVMAHLRSV